MVRMLRMYVSEDFLRSGRTPLHNQEKACSADNPSATTCANSTIRQSTTVQDRRRLAWLPAWQARFLWDPTLPGGVFSNIEAELALRAAALTSGALRSVV